jgi:arsenate reductase-like glutaredoxin family protein
MEGMTGVQIFGVRDSAATRAAERFFKERGVAIQFVDLKRKPMAPGEIRRFAERFGLAGLLDREGKAYAESGLAYLRLSEAELLGKIERDPRLLRLPLVRSAQRVSIGHDEAAWKTMVPVRPVFQP